MDKRDYPQMSCNFYVLFCRRLITFFHFTFSLYILIFAFFILFPSISHATEEDPLKDMDLNSLTEETSVEEKAKFLSISGYLESRNQIRVKDVDEPISLRQRVWLDCYLGQGMRIAQRQPEDEMRKCEVIYYRDLIMLEYESVPVP